MANVNTSTLGSAQPKSNIFSMPLKAKLEANVVLRKKNSQSAFIRLGIALVLVAAYSYQFFYPQMVEYLNFETKMKAAQGEIVKVDASLADLQKKRDLHKAAYDGQFKEQQTILNSVFPETTDKIGVIRLMENFATNLNTTYPPFEFNNISFQEPIKKDGYMALPFQTTIRTSRTNFDRFLELVKLSGNADPASQDHIRLMDISNISLRYLGVDSTGKDLGVDFNIQMNAYSR
jgi:hypothetical protein